MQATEQLTATTQQRTSPFTALRLPDVVIVLALFLLALAPRLLAPGDFWTADEAKHWSVRVDTFLPAVQDGEYEKTNLVGHPGVTTMWLGSLGVLMHQGLASMGIVAPDDPFLYRTFLRVPIALVTSLCIALAYPLLRRLLDKRLALLATLLWAGDPFLVAHSKVLHVDALLTFFIIMSLLTAMVGFRLDEHTHPAESIPQSNTTQRTQRTQRVRWPMLVLSAVLGGLALLTKSPSLILIPMTGLVALTSIVLAQPADGSSGVRYWQRMLLSYGGAIGLWGIVAAITWVALWPAAWVDPLGAVNTIYKEIVKNGAEPHGWGNYFMGRVVGDPGPLLYPVAIALRLTPWSTLGLLAAGGLAISRIVTAIRRPPAGDASPPFAMHRLVRNPTVALLLVFALTFIGVLSLLAKKFDRYVLPTFPVFDLVAAIGLLWMVDSLRRRFFAAVNPRALAASFVNAAFWIGMILVMAVNLAWYHPYELAYYNPLPGGGAVARRAMYVGWGEGLEKAAAYIEQQYNGCDLGVASWYEYVILPYTCTPVLHQGYITVPGHVHYAVLYVNQVQRQIRMHEIAPFLRERGALVHTVHIHGIEYAYVYQLRQPRQYELTAQDEITRFGSSIRLTGYDVDTSDIRSSGVLTLTLQWQALEDMDTDYNLFVHAFDDAGTLLGQTDVPPGGPFQPTSEWGHNRFIDWIHRVPVQADIDTHHLWLSLGIYDPQSMGRLPLHGLTHSDAPDDGPHTLMLPVQLEEGEDKEREE